MDTLIDQTPEAMAWLVATKATISSKKSFGKLVGGVIWTDDVGSDGSLLVDADPSTLVAEVNAGHFPLYRGHDPGLPNGAVLAAEQFRDPNGTRFVAALIGLYDTENSVSFRNLQIDTLTPVSSPLHLDDLPEGCWVDVEADPREVDSLWLAGVAQNCPLPVKAAELSHNAAIADGELLRIGLIYLALVWNPLVTNVGSEAGKHIYAGIHQWLKRLWERLAERRNPVVDIQSTQDGCQVSFLFRGTEVKRHYAAHDALPQAAAHAAKLIHTLKSRGAPARCVVYEFEPKDSLWFPSYAILEDERLVTERSILIALEHLGPELSLGIKRGNEKPKPPK